MFRRTKNLLVVVLVGLLLPTVTLSKTEEVKKETKKEVKIQIGIFKIVKRGTSWMYNLEVINPKKYTLTAKVFAKDSNGNEKEIEKTDFSKYGISKKFENNDYKSLRVELSKGKEKLDEKSVDLAQVKAEIINFSLKGERWFLKVRNKTTESMRFNIAIVEESTTGMKSTILEYKTQNLDPEITHSRTAALDKLNINDRLSLIVTDLVSKKVLAAKTITIK